MSRHPLLLSVAALLASGSASAQTVDCTLTILDFDGDTVEQAASCEIVDDGATFEFLGRLEENDVAFIALANRDERTAFLIGAGTFFLVDGQADVSNDAVIWPNGYAVRLSR
ncbi:hypothetical protein LX81_01742 [Palleronia aestuarii]|uniref:Uncharacterized protein n=1 Tax=Palleronia aestuarii TaxID=568105 RepID=A0A2W7NAT5_9RHOB|nr:hypothetical protein [Palleronia aestuarii]PZX17110.1 hypothetical protein LX81_01742 [Palleronia aestuarii]